MRTPRRSDALAEHLREKIASARIPAGEKLPSESALMAEHRVSRTVVREALGRLHAEGLISTRRGLGSFALTPPRTTAPRGARPIRTLNDRLDLLQYRLALEPEAAALAALAVSSGAVTTQQQAALEAECEAFSAAVTNPASAMRHDFAFHRSVAAACGNTYLLDAVETLGPVMIAMPSPRLRTDNSDAAARHHEMATQEHRDILSAVTEADSAGAAAAARVHLTNSRRRMLSDHL
ncbi:FadR/GntR family transcriptional regulator [Nesterenkonia muleiensis]|uniref:FadR/GntR family transcriptional regulator n=1 Tax=Nesterenkonia muleiensis TaxID=2282648 RepID=UPI001EE4632A|nr:FCD domain-containing protein [Nesterenkonia muleiensis]